MQYLYRAFAEDKTLLYIGVSNNLSNRLHSHEKTSEWLCQTDWIRVERYPDRESVLRAERKAIKKEKPRYNKQHSTLYEHPGVHWRDLKKWIKSGEAPDSIHQDIVDDVERIAGGWRAELGDLRPSAMAFLYLDVMNGMLRRGESICRNCKGVLSCHMLDSHAWRGELQLSEGWRKNGTY